MKKLFLFFFISLFLVTSVYAEVCEVDFFYSPTCPYCAEEKPFLAKLEQRYPDLKVNSYLVSDNYDLFEQMNEEYDSVAVGIPRTFIGDKVFIGFDSSPGELSYSQGYKAYIGTKNQIELAILDCIGSGNANQTGVDIPDKPKNLVVVPLLLFALYLLFLFIFKEKLKKRYIIGTFLGFIIVILYYLSQNLPNQSVINFAGQFSFPVFTFIIALLDGFNPCAFAVLAVLLSLLIYAKSKTKMALIGLIFILTSGIMYFLFIIVLLALRSQILGAYAGTIRTAVGVIALVAGAINLKDFFFFKKGISLTISSDKMNKLVKKMKKIVDDVRKAETKHTLFLAILGTIMIAILVNVIELGCTLILPVQYIEILVTNFGSQVGTTHYLYTMFYSIIYIIPLLTILGVFLYSFKSMRVKEMQGRVLKLIGGLVMVGLGLILIFRPELLLFH
jgi:thiol-disulfide isomerase/thioredoxin